MDYHLLQLLYGPVEPLNRCKITERLFYTQSVYVLIFWIFSFEINFHFILLFFHKFMNNVMTAVIYKVKLK